MTKNSKMEDKRKYKRFQIDLNAKYLLEKNPKEWKGCTVVNISRDGMGIIVSLRESIPIGSLLQLEIMFPTQEEPIKAIGVLRWIKEQLEEMNFPGGIELTKIDPEDKWTLLDYAYDNLSTKEKG